jgi:signal transduction histidine kinase
VGASSLRYRLLTAAAVTILLALLLSAFSLVRLFELHLERRVNDELDTYLSQLVGRIVLDAQGRVRVRGELANPQFDVPLGGLYWQIQDDERPTLLRSRSLWDDMIELPRDRLAPGEVHRHELAGPHGQRLIVSERAVILLPESAARRLRVAVARDRAELDAARHGFTADMLLYFLLLAAFLFAATWVQVGTGLAPLELVRRGVLGVRESRERRLEGAFPNEVMPLVEAINDLLDTRERTVEQARAWTADLAHGLKTPLSALGADAQRLRAAGQVEVADDLDLLAQTMRRRVDRELVRARLRTAGPAAFQRADVVGIVTRIVRTLQRTPRGAALQWTLDLPDTIEVRAREDDLMELVGNLLDNACKWAGSAVWVKVRRNGGVSIRIDDDGPGVAEDQCERLGERGLRLDEQMQGSGLGLAIARDIVDAHGGVLVFERSPRGGLAVEARFEIA